MKYTRMSSIKSLSRATIGKQDSQAGGLEEKGSGWSTDDPRFSCATLISNKEPNMIQDLESGHKGRGESESY